ncbi:VWA domain-containing protein [Patescibacteria group bacterium]
MTKKKSRKLIKTIIYISVFSLMFYSSSINAVFNFVPQVKAAENGAMCDALADVILLIDRSGSMGDGDNPSLCVWYELEWVGPSKQCVQYSENDLSEVECLVKTDPVQCASPDFTPATQDKMYAAKGAANSFLNNMGTNDQSGLVSFADNATLDKALSTDHNATKSTVDVLTTNGSTNIGDAIEFGTQQFNINGNGQASKVMILLTDGKANKPNGSGFGEDPADVQHAEDKALEASAENYKIFTIGLGSNSDINETMLQNIANSTNADYYHAPTSDDLEQVYQDISQKICEYSSVSGCKYSDLNNNGIIDQDEITLSDWEIVLTNGVATSTQTTIDGCYTFSGLVPDNYTLSEVFPTGEDWIQTASPTPAVIDLDWEQNLTNMNFLNYLPICGNNILDNGEECDDNNTDDNDGCSAICEIEVSEPVCGDGVQEGDEECDGLDGVGDGQFCNQSCILEDIPIGPFCGDGNIDQGENEACDDAENNGIYGYCNADCTGQTQAICGNSIVEGDEQCDDGNQINNDGCDACQIVYECNDGLDNDDDGLIDYPEDPGCDCLDDDDETDMTEVLIQQGDIVINEIIQNPSAVSDTSGEWFEVYNTTQQSIDLQECIIFDNDNDSHNINGSLIVPSLGYVVLARNGDPNTNGGFAADYVYPFNFILGNSIDEIILTCGDTEIDRVEYDNGATFPDPAGASMILADPGLDNNVGANWCESSSSFGDGDLGTPGAVNDICEGIDPPAPETGSIKICKYEDEDGDVDTCDDKTPLDGWVFDIGTNGHAQTATTTQDGCVTVDNFDPDFYIIDEQIPDGWTSVWPGNNTTTQVIAGETSEVNFYNFKYGLIGGYKYEDTDGEASTIDDWTPLGDWEIHLYDSTQTLIATTTTTSTGEGTGYFEFNNLLAGDYSLGEELPAGWVQFKYSTTTFTIYSGVEYNTSTKSDFVNYYDESIITTYCGDGLWQQPNQAGTGGPQDDGYEECDGTANVTTGYYCTEQCVLAQEQTGGGGGGGGGGGTRSVCGDGILNEKTEECDSLVGVPEGYMCTNECLLELIEVEGPVGGDDGTGGEEPEEEGTGEEPEEVVPVVEGVVTGEGEIQGEQDEEPTESTQEIVLGDEISKECDWWLWLIVILLLLIIVFGYHWVLKDKDNVVPPNDQLRK